MNAPAIRAVRIGDAGSIAAIYAHHVLYGTASFDTGPPDEAFGCKLDSVNMQRELGA